MEIKIVKAIITDLPFLKELEKTCFQSFQQLSDNSIKNSLSCSSKEVFIAKIKDKNKWTSSGALVLYKYKNTLRLFSVAVLPQYRTLRVGKRLIDYSFEKGKEENYEFLSLEVLSSNTSLIEWYEQFGFKTVEELEDYYAPGIHGFRMKCKLHESELKSKFNNLIVIEGSKTLIPKLSNTSIVTANEYITNTKYQTMKKARVYNLCQSYKYQGMGYYVSLLASARNHRVIPSVTTIVDFNNISLIKTISSELDDLIQKIFKGVEENKICIHIFFGQTHSKQYRALAHKLFMLFEAPLLKVCFVKSDKWYISKVKPITLTKVIEDGEYSIFEQSMAEYFTKSRFVIPRLKNYKYDIAVLVNPDEKTPPSNAKALENLKKVAEKKNIYIEFITKKDVDRISEFDALFIRETTNVNDYTYNIARIAYAEGLAVIDDPWSILRCSNKIYLYERMLLNDIKMPFSKVLSKKLFKIDEVEDMDYPLVLKQPDGSFSKGVKKVNNKEELEAGINELFKTSELIISQEFMPSDYDWRVGVLDNKAIFACKYYMAKGHWQIYNWARTDEDVEGEFAKIPIDEVPENVLHVAIKSASLMGDGLYGVDLKEINGEVFLIEVNDNPNIDYGVEDSVLKDELYEIILDSFVNRIEMSRSSFKYVAADPV